MAITRRELLSRGAVGLGGVALARRLRAQTNGYGPMGIDPSSPKPTAVFVNPLRVPPIATPESTAGGVDFYRLAIEEFGWNFDPNGNSGWGTTKVWGFADYRNMLAAGQAGAAPREYLGGIIAAQKNRPVQIRFHHRLKATSATPGQHLVTVDPTITAYPKTGAGTFVHDAVAVHLHGGHVPWQSDGHPLSWFTEDPAVHGSYFNPNPAVGLTSYTFNYPNDQTARLVWYHDHAVGLTRINAYAGIASAYIMRDAVEQAMIQSGALPSGGKELFLVLQDKAFQNLQQPKPGQLWYPDTYDPLVFNGAAGPVITPSCVPEMFGDVNLVNGYAYPDTAVEPRRYRLRLLNGAQSRFYRLRLYWSQDGINPVMTAPGPAMYQVATESGFLPATVTLNTPSNPNGPKLLLAPAERADVIVDFSSAMDTANSAFPYLILWNDAPGPFPVGTFPVLPGNDWYEGAVMRFTVNRSVARETAQGAAVRVPTAAQLWPQSWNSEKLTAAMATRTLTYTLNEGFDNQNRLMQLIGTNVVTNYAETTFGQEFIGANMLPAASEVHRLGDIEVWNILNLTADTHPMHMHVVDYQILSRQPIDSAAYMSSGGTTLTPLGPAAAPDPNERGWKETARMNPGTLTKIAMRISPLSAWLPPAGQSAHYVWHCHILEHEEHDMMRGFEIGRTRV